MAGTAPTSFHFIRTLDAGPVHCNVGSCRSSQTRRSRRIGLGPPISLRVAPRGLYFLDWVAAGAPIEHLLHPLQALRRGRVRLAQANATLIALAPDDPLRVNQSVEA